MPIYTFAKDVRKSYLSPKYLDESKKTYQGIIA